MKRSLAALLAVLALAGCRIHASGPERPLKPEGESITIDLAKKVKISGEFLALRGESLVLLGDGLLLEVPLASFKRVAIKGYPAVTIKDREKLLLYARYPQGLSDEQWRELLRQRGQEDFDQPPE
jgi:hypothetical protein